MKKIFLPYSLIIFFLKICFINSLHAQSCTVNVGFDDGSTESICQYEDLFLRGSTQNDVIGTPTWKLINAPDGVTIADPSNLQSQVLGIENAAGQVITLELSAECGTGTAVQTINYRVAGLSTPEINGLVSGQELCPGEYILSANAPSVDGDSQTIDETGIWRVAVPQGVFERDLLQQAILDNISDINDPNATLTLPENRSGPFQLTWRMSRNNGISCQRDATINLFALGGELTVDAGDDVTLNSCYSVTQNHTLNASYGGWVGTNQAGNWEVVSGPNIPNMTFSDTSPHINTISGMVAGTYVFRWEVSGDCVNDSDEVTVTVPESTQSVTQPVAFSANYCDNRTSVTLSGNVPELEGEIVEWSQTGGPAAGVVIDNSNQPTAVVSGLDGVSDYEFEYRITSAGGECFDRVLINITFTQASFIQVDGVGIQVSNGILELACNNSFTPGISYLATGGDIVEYAIISAPNGFADAYPASFNNFIEPEPNFQANSQFRLTGLTHPGEYIVRVRNRSFDSECSVASEDITIVASFDPSSANAGSSLELACGTTETNLQGNTPYVDGTFDQNDPNDPNDDTGIPAFGLWSLLTVPDGVDPNTVIIDDSSQANSRVSGLVSGSYEFIWTIYSGNLCENSVDTTRITIAENIPTIGINAAGNDETICTNSVYTLNGNAVPAGAFLEWTVTSVPTANATNIVIKDSSDPNTEVRGLMPNTQYTFTYTVSNSCGTPASDQVEITTNGTQGVDQAEIMTVDQCLSITESSVLLEANAPLNGTGTWTWAQLSGSNAAVTINNANDANTVANGLNEPGTYEFTWTVTSGAGCAPSSDKVIITIADPITEASVEDDKIICGNSTTLTSNNNMLGLNEMGTWTQTAGPAGSVIEQPNVNVTNLTNLLPGNYEYTWTITNGVCKTSSAVVGLIVALDASPAVINGGDITECNGTSVMLDAEPVTVGTGIWSVVGTAPNVPTFDDISNPNATISDLIAGIYTLRWTTSSSYLCDSNSDEITVTISDAPNAGEDQFLCNESVAYLEGNAGSIGTWSQNGGDAHTDITIDQTGNSAIVTGLNPDNTYNFIYTIPDNGVCGIRADEVRIINSGFGNAPNAGTDQTLCNAGSFSLNATSGGTGQWTIVEAPVGNMANFDDDTSPQTDFNSPSIGTYLFRWTVTNGNCEVSDLVIFDNLRAPDAADAGENQNVCVSDGIVLGAENPANGIGSWSVIAVPTGASVPLFSSTLAANAEVTNIIAGNYTFRWTVSTGGTGACSDTFEDIDVLVEAAPSPTGASAQSYCSGEDATIGDLVVNENTTIVWYDAATGGNALAETTLLADGTTYYAGQLINGCESTSRLEVTVTLNDLPSAPTGASAQSYCSGEDATIGELVVNENTTIVWYDAATGGNALAETTLLADGTTYYAGQLINGCESTSRLEVTVTLNDLPSAPTGASAQSYCSGEDATIGDLVVNENTTIVWYDAATGGNALAETTLLADGTTYYAGQLINGCESTSRLEVTVTLNDLPSAPTGASAQSYCSGEDATIGDLVVNENTTIVWYDAATGGNALAETTLLADGTTYYAGQLINGCESTSRLEVTVTLNDLPSAPTGASAQSYCSGEDATIGELVVNENTTIVWYDAATGGNALAETTLLADGTTYYVGQLINGCESTSRLEVTVTLNDLPSAPTGASAQSYCSGEDATIGDLVVNENTTIVWYDAATGGNALAEATLLTDGTTYYAGQLINGCESTSRLEVTVTLNDLPSAPTGASAQSYCSGEDATIGDLVVNENTTIVWYDAATGGNALAETTLLADGTTYYASQLINGCESTSRLEVTVTLNDLPSAPTGASAQSYCSGEDATIGDLVVNENTTIVWYDAATGGNALAEATLLTDGTTYYASQLINGCESTSRLGITVAVASEPTLMLVSLEEPTCGLNDGTILLSFTNVPDGTYEISYEEEDGSASVFVNVEIMSGQASVNGLGEGTYNNLGIEVNNCSSSLDLDVEISCLGSTQNSPPVAESLTLNTRQNTSVSSQVTATDPDDDQLTYALLSPVAPSQGTVMINADGSFTFIPANGFTGLVSFTYQVCDDGDPVLCDESLVIINVNSDPVVANDVITPNNPVWRIDGIEDYPENKVAIFNRWGNMVHEFTNYDNNSGFEAAQTRLPDGTYYYVITLKDQSGERIVKGFFELKR